MVTLKELSKLLGISVSTVSKALNDSEEISDLTKEKVKKLAEELNYKPNRIAQQLKSNKTKTVGVIIPSIINPFFAEVLHGIEEEASKHDYDIIICLSNELLDKEQRSIEMLANGSVDGFLIAVARESQVEGVTDHLQDVLNSYIPLLMFDRVIDDIDCQKVIVDDFQSIYEATKYLIEEEHRSRILLISNIEDLSVGKLRIDGYSEAVKAHNLTPEILRLGDANDVETIIYQYLKENTDIDAIISIDHITGIVALNMAKKLGRIIPDDISLMGFGYKHTEILSSPKISMIHQKAFEIGELALRLLLEDIKSGDITTKTTVLPNVLKLYDTTK